MSTDSLTEAPDAATEKPDPLTELLSALDALAREHHARADSAVESASTGSSTEAENHRLSWRYNRGVANGYASAAGLARTAFGVQS